MAVRLVTSEDGNLPRFETDESHPRLKKPEWVMRKRLERDKKNDLLRRRAAIKRDPRRVVVQGVKKERFKNAEQRIKFHIQMAKAKEALLIEKLKKYEAPTALGPSIKPVNLTAEERFYIIKTAQKRTNYCVVGKRGLFGNVILNMHLHWKRHETVKVFCKPCRPGQVHEYAREIARLSGGTPVQIIGDDTIIFYRGKDYVRPKYLSPVDSLTKRKALLRAIREQALNDVRHNIAVAEKQLELYYRHVALYGDPYNRNPLSILNTPGKPTMLSDNACASTYDCLPSVQSEMQLDSTNQELSEIECDSEDEDLFASTIDELSETEGNSEDEDLSTSTIDQELSETGGDSEDENLPASELDPETNILSGYEYYSGDED